MPKEKSTIRAKRRHRRTGASEDDTDHTAERSVEVTEPVLVEQPEAAQPQPQQEMAQPQPQPQPQPQQEVAAPQPQPQPQPRKPRAKPTPIIKQKKSLPLPWQKFLERPIAWK